MRTATGSTPAPSFRAAISYLLPGFIAFAVVMSLLGDAEARKRKRGNPKYAAYVIDANTGKVLHSRYANARRYPASLTKMMTLYLVFEDLKAGKISKSSRVVMTRNAAKRPPSKLGIKPGRSVSVEQAILALVTKSANDVSTAVAEKLAGSEPAFARRMTATARKLGMKSTTFKNANGLTARGQVTTASDMAKLGLALREHYPREFRYFNTRLFKYGKRRYGNHNRLLGRVRGVNGIKTGYTRASGFNLVTSVSTGGRRIVAVVMGGRSGKSRNAQMAKLIRTYLPKASRGKGRMLIAKPRGSSSTMVAQVAMPKAVPLPSFSPSSVSRLNDRIAVAHAVSKTKPVDIEKVRKQLARLKAQRAPTPEQRPIITASVQKPVAAGTATLETPKSGWQIQIAATDTRAKAVALLAKARSRSHSVLASTSTYTQQIVRNGVPLYRARFTGFSSKRSAKKACKALKRKRFACIPLHV